MNEINQTPEQKQNDIDKRNKIIAISAGVIIVLAVIAYFVFFNKNKTTETIVTTNQNADSLKALLKDSVAVISDSVGTVNNDEYGEEGSPFSEYRVISSSVQIPSGDLKFGEQVWVDYRTSTESVKTIYLTNPDLNKNQPKYNVAANNLIDSYSFDDYKSNFSLAPFSSLSGGVKKLILSSNYNDGNTYKLTQNAARAKTSIAYGDYDGDGLTDVAVIMDSNEKQISRLLILCSNSATKQAYMAFAENYSDKMKVRGFKKGASVYMNTSNFTRAPQDGIVISGEDIVLAVIYDAKLQKFKTYTQEEMAYSSEAAMEAVDSAY